MGLAKAEIYNLLAEAYENKGQTAAAYEALRTATRLEPKDEVNYLDLIALCIEHKNYDLALEIADIGVSRLPQSSRLQVQRGTVFAMKDDFPSAKAAFQRAQSLSQSNNTPTVALALSLIQTNRTAEAIALLRDRVRSGSGNYLALWFLGEALNRAGAGPDSAEEREAVSALESSIKLNPQLCQPKILLAKFLAREGQVARASTLLEESLKIEPDNVTAMYQLAQAYSKAGETARAKQLFAKVSKAKSDDREQFTHSGLQQILREDRR